MMTKKEIAERLDSLSFRSSRALVNLLSVPGIHTFAAVQANPYATPKLRVFTTFDFEAVDARFPFWRELQVRYDAMMGTTASKYDTEFMPFRTADNFVKLNDERYHSSAVRLSAGFTSVGLSDYAAGELTEALAQFGCSAPVRMGCVDPETLEIGFDAKPEDYAVLRLAPELTHKAIYETARAFRKEQHEDLIAKAEAVLSFVQSNPELARELGLIKES